MEILKLGVLILTVLVLTGAIPTLSKEITMLITFSCCTVVLLYILDSVAPVIDYIKEENERTAGIQAQA